MSFDQKKHARKAEKKAKSISFSLSKSSHVEAMKMEINFLAEVNRYPLLHKAGPVLTNAVRRYETLFLSRLCHAAKKSCLNRAPLDIQWIWHCHMLSPLYYINDCKNLIGKVPDHCVSYEEKYQPTKQMRDLWNALVPSNEPFEVDLTCVTQFPGGPEYQPRCSYDLVGAAERQSEFYYNVSLPHYRDEKFLLNGIHRYRMMLYLKVLHPDAFLVPCYDSDLAWHTHQLHPHMYQADTVNLFGKVFNHDDNMTDRSAESHLAKSEQETRKLWSDTYNTSMSLSGAMYRGPSPIGKIDCMSHNESAQICDVNVRLFINYVTLLESQQRKVRLTVHLDSTQLYSRERKKLKTLSTLDFGSYNKELSLFDHGNSNYRFSFYQVGQGRCTPDLMLGQAEVSLRKLFKRNRTEPMIIERKIPLDECTAFVLGTATVSTPGAILLSLLPGEFKNVVMPENIASLWGPIPLRRLPAGSLNHCTVASHRLMTPDGILAFTVRVIHCIPLLMSCVQVFYQDRMVAVSHLVGTDQIPDSKQVKNKNGVVNIRSGERAMLIKDATGDQIIVLGMWANRKVGVPGTPTRRGVQGRPGHFQIRSFNNHSSKWQLVQPEITIISADHVEINNIIVDFGKGTVRLPDSKGAPLKVAFAFSIGVLRCLCQPPPPGITPPTSHTDLGPIPPPPKYTPQKRGDRTVEYSDGAGLALIAAAGWLMASPGSFYFRTCYDSNMHSSGVCAGACGVSDAACAGGGCGGCGGCGGGADGGGCGGCGGCGGGCGGGGGGGGGCGGGCGGGGCGGG